MTRHAIVAILLLSVGFAAGYFVQSQPAPQPPAPLTFDAIAHRRLPRVELHATTLGGAVKYVHEVTGIDIAAEWPHDSAGIVYQTPFDPDLSFRDVTVGQFLSRLNAAVDPWHEEMQIDICNGFLKVRPVERRRPDFGEDADADYHNVVTCIYDVEPLITSDGPWERLAIPWLDEPLDLPMNLMKRKELLEHTIMKLVAPDSWKDAGGVTGSQHIRNGRLIVTQTPPNQRAIYEVIKTLRAAK